MADYPRFQQYEYRSNSNLVLTVERRERRDPKEPKGEPESLWGKLRGRMGDLAQRTRPKELEEKLERMRQRAKKERQEGIRKTSARESASVLTAKLEVGRVYRPRTEETRRAYEELLAFVRRVLGDQPRSVLTSAAETVLSTLKNDRQTDPERKKTIESDLGGPITKEEYADLVNLGKRITDFSTDRAEGKMEPAEEQVAIVIDEDEAEEDEDAGFVVHDESEEEEEGVETTTKEALVAAVDREAMQVDGGVATHLELDPRQVDGFWLQRELSKHFPDAMESQRMADEVLNILDTNPDPRDAEDDLVRLLDFNRFDFVKLLLRNRNTVLYCTRLGQAQSSEERRKIEAEMQSNPELLPIWEALHRTKPSTGRGIDQTLRQEARTLHEKAASTADKEELAVGERRLLDLESLAFSQGSHFMANKQCILPEGSFRTQHKGYEEVHIPALKEPAYGASESLISIATLPEWTHGAFPKMKTLNRVQSRLYRAAFHGGDNLLLCAPTGAGKTNVAMLAILREIGRHRNPATGEINKDAFKIIYIAPMKSLVQEMVLNFGHRLKDLGITVRELSGDVHLTKQQIAETQLIITTPEKFDIITRKAGDRAFTQLVRLVIIDEIHLLHDTRGPVLECLVARLLRQIESTQEMVRLVGLSATLPNYEDVATFLRVQDDHLFVFDNSYRPVPLEQTYIGITQRNPLKRMQLMNEITYRKVMQQMAASSAATGGPNQVLVFVHSRKDTVKTAKMIRDMAMAAGELGKIVDERSAAAEILRQEAANAKTPELRELLPLGIAIHHAGLPRADRDLVEDLYVDRNIAILVSTATLAWGVNLPAHCVIVKGTEIYSPERGDWVELSPLDVMQMFGRAGRPAFDTRGEGILITSHSELQYYLSLLNQQLPIESQLISRLPDSLNAEIVLGTVGNVREAVEWLGYTYLYVCMLRSPTLYGIAAEEADVDATLERRRADLVHSAAVALDKAQLIRYDRKTGNFQITDLGRIASHYYVSHASMATYNEQLRPTLTDVDIFRLFALSEEFRYIVVRAEERLELEKLVERVPVPIQESIDEPVAKVNVLLQAYISRLKLEGFALMADMVYITQSAARISRALFEIALRRGWAQLAEKLLDLCKMIDRRQWLSQSPLAQFTGAAAVPSAIIRRLEKRDFPFERLFDLSASELGELLHMPAQGKPLHRLLRQFPRLALAVAVQPLTRALLGIELRITPDFEFREEHHGNAEAFWVLVEDADMENILHAEQFILKKKFADEEHTLSFAVPLLEPLPPQYFIRVISDRWLRAESTLPVSFRHLILPEKNPPPTELLDYAPRPVTDLRTADPRFERYFREECGITAFNTIQTQCFDAVFKMDANVFIAAPAGSGKTALAELAIFRLMAQRSRDENSPNARIRVVYVAPLEPIARLRYEDWDRKFARVFQRRVALLTGDSVIDLRLLDEADIVVATPEKWDALSRRWRQRRAVQLVQLFIVDELHLLAEEGGHVLEVGVSRVRHMSTLLDAEAAKAEGATASSAAKPRIRIVALSAPVANARDLGEWIGALPGATGGAGSAKTAATIFNFHPTARPMPLEVHLKSFDQSLPAARLAAMSKPMLNAVSRYALSTAKGPQPAIVFVPDRTQMLATASELIAFAEGSDGTGHQRPLLHLPAAEVAPYLEKIVDVDVREAMSFGVALFHEGLCESDRRIATRLFDSGAAGVMVATATSCWGVGSKAHLVVVMATQRYDGREHRYVDYPVADVLHMMGRAVIGPDTAVAVVLTHSAKKEYLKRFLYEPLPVESHVDHFLADHFNAEIVIRTIENKQDAVDWLTWTLLYRRLSRNPNYYNMTGVSHKHLSDHLSELVESTVGQLEAAKCIAVENDMDLSPLNLGIIATYYYITHTTVERFASSLKPTTKLRGLLEILSYASEYDNVPVRQHDGRVLSKLAAHLPLKIRATRFSEPHVKANVLLQSHFSRKPLPTAELREDQIAVVADAPRLIQAMVDVIASSGWLNPALAAMELSQMVTQAVWPTDSPLRQLPHCDDAALLARCAEKGVESVFDLMDLDDDVRRQLLQLDNRRLADVARVCNGYPNVQLTYSLERSGVVPAESATAVNVRLEREVDENAGEELPVVYAPFFPKEKAEGWWLVVGDPKTNQLFSIKRVALKRRAKVKLEFNAPATAGEHNLMLYFICDGYTGCDQEYEFKLTVAGGEASAEGVTATE